MTGFKNSAEFVLPITISVASLLGRTVAEKLLEKRLLFDIINELRRIQFTRVEEAQKSDRDYLEETDLWKEVYTDKRTPMNEIDLSLIMIKKFE